MNYVFVMAAVAAAVIVSCVLLYRNVLAVKFRLYYDNVRLQQGVLPLDVLLFVSARQF